MYPTLTGLAAGFVFLLVVFRLLELTRPKDQRMRLFRPGLATDLGYWLFTPYATKLFSEIAILLLVIPFGLIVYGVVDKDLLLAGFGPLSRLPLWQQAILMLIIADFAGYWVHRAMHRGRLWRFHAVHHSSEQLDWIASLRIHPVNDAITRLAGALPLLALGFSPVALATVVPIITIFAIGVHANLTWDWGPFRRVIVSPLFHRWHHTSEKEGRDKNFAGLLPIWDILFGTYYMPAGKVPEKFGVDMPMPRGLWGQLVFPFRRDA